MDHHHRRRRCHDRITNIIILFFSIFPLAFSQSFTPTTNTLLNCGSTSGTIQDGRNFISDDITSAKFSSSGPSLSATDPKLSTASLSTIYQTARVFTAAYSYEFHVNNPGTHFLRLHFAPFTIAEGRHLSSATFHVSALDTFSLLTKFSTNTTNPIIKEYTLWIPSGDLKLIFTPIESSFAFVNAIEVFSTPTNLIPDQFSTYITPSGLKDFPVPPTKTAMETMARVNIGGDPILAANDTLWRTWTSDQHFLYSDALAERVNTSQPIKYLNTGSTREIAPARVYSTAERMKAGEEGYFRIFNITWVFPVVSGHAYFVRLHFCDFVSETVDELYFNVYVNNMTATQDVHPSEKTEQLLAVPFYMDYEVDSEASGNVRVSVGRSMKSSESKANAILNGVEIMRMNNSAGSLDGEANLSKTITGHHRKRFVLLVSSISSAVVVVVLVIILFLTCKSYKRIKTETIKGSGGSGTTMNLSLHISHDEIKLATNDFDESLVVGSGGFGKVYKGRLKDGTSIAVKRGQPRSGQGYPEFVNEVLVLSQICHRHLVSFVGYCNDDDQMILVYEYMDKGTLKQYLRGGEVVLSWKQRLNICIGAAGGLHYLHTGYSPGIIHRDVKSSNILLDGEEFFAKVSDFGLSRMGPDVGKSHVSTVVKGSFGYVDPEYYKTQKLTLKSDVYSFGVVLLEVLCCRPAVDTTLSRGEMSLAEWALGRLKRGKLEEIIDPRLQGTVNDASVRKFAETAEKCVEESSNDRPTMGQVLWNLEYCLQLQEREQRIEIEEDSVARDEWRTQAEYMPTAMAGGETETRTVLPPSVVFSQLMTNEGR